ncbi:hypothetical protein CSB20_08840 [bacterium DOLZORAL124_64_63]|nr:MAG: hypothetical protein CSB20_08840 [bacterium DOLZORAL124_64_63]
MSNVHEKRQKLPLGQRARSVPCKRPFVVAVLATVVFYLGLVCFLTCAVVFAISPPEQVRSPAYAMIGMLPVCALLWAIAYFKLRKATCPLCKSTPFLDNLACKHQKSFRVKPFNYGTTAILNVVCCQRWRCMYCGTPFDLLKPKKESGYVAYRDHRGLVEAKK